MSREPDQSLAGWDADRYEKQFGCISDLGQGVLDLLAPQPGETVLDLGCGPGKLAAAIRERGSRVVTLDADPAMVEAARRRLGQPVLLADAADFRLDQPVDAVFSNAALHWMTRPTDVLRSVHRALRPGGRFVAEFGGAGNLTTIIGAAREALAEHGLAEGMRLPWYFPTPAEYATLLEAHGFQVARLEHFPRSTALADCHHGVADWLVMFGTTLTAHVPADVLPAVLDRVNELCAPRLCRDGTWYADYVRLRFLALRRTPADTPYRGVR